MQLSFRGLEGDYEVLVTIHSLVLRESRCAECYGGAGEAIKRNHCCDEDNKSSCPDSCDILLRFCQLDDLPQFNIADTSFKALGTQCGQSMLLSRVEDVFANNFRTGETYRFDEVGLLGGMFMVLRNPVAYNDTGNWVNYYYFQHTSIAYS